MILSRCVRRHRADHVSNGVQAPYFIVRCPCIERRLSQYIGQVFRNLANAGTNVGRITSRTSVFSNRLGAPTPSPHPGKTTAGARRQGANDHPRRPFPVTARAPQGLPKHCRWRALRCQFLSPARINPRAARRAHSDCQQPPPVVGLAGMEVLEASSGHRRALHQSLTEDVGLEGSVRVSAGEERGNGPP